MTEDGNLPEMRVRASVAVRVWSWVKSHKVAVAFLVAPVALFIIVYIASLPSNYDGTVVDATWTHTIVVERYQAWPRSAFREELPLDAFDVRSDGEKVHHYDSVQDGTKSERYTVRESCGVTCTNRGRSCSTRYCDRDRWRTVPAYKQVPRYAESFAYKLWDWDEHRKVQATGRGTTDLRWPDAEAKIGEGLGDPREQERGRREGKYLVTIEFEGRRITFDVTADAFARYAIGTSHEVVVKTDWGETIEVDGATVVPQ